MRVPKGASSALCKSRRVFLGGWVGAFVLAFLRVSSAICILLMRCPLPPAGYFPCKYRVPSLRYQASLKKALLQAFFWPLLGSWTESDWLHSIEFFSKALCFSQYFWVFFSKFQIFPSKYVSFQPNLSQKSLKISFAIIKLVRIGFEWSTFLWFFRWNLKSTPTHWVFWSKMALEFFLGTEIFWVFLALSFFETGKKSLT